MGRPKVSARSATVATVVVMFLLVSTFSFEVANASRELIGCQKGGGTSWSVAVTIMQHAARLLVPVLRPWDADQETALQHLRLIHHDAPIRKSEHNNKTSTVQWAGFLASMLLAPPHLRSNFRSYKIAGRFPYFTPDFTP